MSLDTKSECSFTEFRNKTIASPSEKLKSYQKFLNSFVFDFVEIDENVVHAYRSSKNIYTAVAPHRNSKYFFKSDIVNFFSSIIPSDVEYILSSKSSASPIIDLANHVSTIINLVTIDNELPIGFATSPSITNSVLSEFDHELASYCNDNAIVYTRYSDDLILSGNSFDLVSQLGDIVQSKLDVFFKSRLQLNRRKTMTTHSGNKVKFLGLIILPNGHITVDSKLKKGLESILHFYINDKDRYNSFLEEHFSGDPTVVSGKLNFVNVVDKEFLNRLRKKYGNFLVDSFVSHSIKK